MTINKLIEELSKLDGSKIVVIMDADEGYDTLLEIMEIQEGGTYIGIGGNYANRYEPEEQLLEELK